MFWCFCRLRDGTSSCLSGHFFSKFQDPQRCFIFHTASMTLQFFCASYAMGVYFFSAFYRNWEYLWVFPEWVNNDSSVFDDTVEKLFFFADSDKLVSRTSPCPTSVRLLVSKSHKTRHWNHEAAVLFCVLYVVFLSQRFYFHVFISFLPPGLILSTLLLF